MNKPADGSYATARSTLINIVCLSLDSDPTLEPRSAKTLPRITSLPEGLEEDEIPDGTPPADQIASKVPPDENFVVAEADEEDDDFIIMSEKQAKRIASLTKAAFDVDLSVDVVVAEPNVAALARRVLGARSLQAGRPG